MKPFVHVSASQFDTFADAAVEPFVGGEGCNRAWYFQYILGYEKPTSASAARGSAIHKLLENHMRKGDALPPDLAQHAGPFLPSPLAIKSGEVRIEHPIHMPVADTGIYLKGYVDLWGRMDIRDWKTSGDTQWFKSPEDLKKNTQMLVYGRANALEFGRGGAGETIRFVHYQLLVPKRSSTVTWAGKTETTVTVEDTFRFWKETAIPLVERMKEVAQIEDVSQVSPNWNACGRFGGCAFRDRCAALKGAGVSGPLRNPFSSEVNMPPIKLSESNIAALNKARGGASDAALSHVAQTSGAKGLVPSDAPPVVTGGMPSAPTSPAQTEFSDADKSDHIVELGWSAEEIEAMDTDVFERIWAGKVQRADVEPVMATDTQGEYIADFKVKPPPAAVVPRRRGVVTPTETVEPAAAPAPVVAATFTPVTIGVTKISQQARRPRNAEPRLVALGYTPEQVFRMSTDTMDILLTKSIPADRVSVLADGRVSVLLPSEGREVVEQEEVVEETTPAPQQTRVDEVPPGPEKTVARVTQTMPATEAAGAMQDALALKDARIAELEADIVQQDKAIIELARNAMQLEEKAALYVERINQLEDALKRNDHVESMPTGTTGYTVYIDCMPEKGETDVVFFADYILPHHIAVAKANGVDHIQSADKLFGRGPGMIAARLLLPAARPTGALVVDSRHPLAAEALASLLPYAGRVIRALR